MSDHPVSMLTYWLSPRAPRVWFHATKPHIIGEVVSTSFARRLPTDLLMSWSMGNHDKRTISPLFRSSERPNLLWCFADANAEHILEADAIREHAAKEGVEVRWSGVLECVLSQSDKSEIEKITIPHKPISRTVVKAAQRLGITDSPCMALLRRGKSIELETILFKSLKRPIATHLRSLMRQSRARK